MKRGFTLLELIVVIVIMGVLATLGLASYSRLIEGSRGAEARQTIGTMRQLAYAYWAGNSDSLQGIQALDIGLGPQGIPQQCAGQTTHLFGYRFQLVAVPSRITFFADRCGIGSGKDPGRQGGQLNSAVSLICDFTPTTGSDAWNNIPPY